VVAFRGTAALRFVHTVSLEVLVTTGSEPGAAAGRGHLRAGHVDREQVIDLLKAAFVAGRLTKDEFDARAGQALTARTYADLAALTADLPAEPPAVRPAHQPSRRRTEPARTPGARNAALASVSCLAGAVLSFGYALRLDDSNSRTLLSLTLVMIVLAVILALGAFAELKRSRGQLPPRPGPGGQARGQRHGNAGRDQSLPGPRTDQHRTDQHQADQHRTDRHRADEHQADLRPHRARPDRPPGRGVRAPRVARPAPTTA
jgi:hypothetical protein